MEVGLCWRGGGGGIMFSKTSQNIIQSPQTKFILKQSIMNYMALISMKAK